ncbi:HepT-like ribonuclease domain-containing protein [Fusibacter ferrireducens]|nr:HepT-like ribonuclease domain-containing protein [Fusibacter ferrireducens]
MADIRDVLIHDYDSIDMSIVWNVISIELPKIKEILNNINLIENDL